MNWGNIHFGTWVLNLFCFPLVAYGLVLGLSSYFWDSQTGEIITSELVSISKGNGWVNVANIGFKYKVHGLKYTSDLVEIGPRINFKKRTFKADFVNKYKVGQAVMVYYPSMYPGFGTLNRGLTLKTIVVAIFSVILLVLGRFAKKRMHFEK